MKKIALILAVFTAVLMLASCGEQKASPDETTYAQMVMDKSEGYKPPKDNQKHEYTVTPGLADYDSDGNLIIESTDNRYVYLSEVGYVIFSFDKTTDSCIQVLEVRKLESEEEASKFLTDHVAELMASGNYTNVHQAKNHVVFTVSLDNPIYGKYMKLTRADVEKDMPETLKCS